MPYYLCVGSDTIEDSSRHHRLCDAVDAFRDVAEELGRYGQRIAASVHIAPKRIECDECPDYVLSVGPRGGIRCERV